MTNNLINVVAKAYAGIIVIVTIIGLIAGKGEISAETIGIAATIGAIVSVGTIMIGELIFEIKIYYRKWKFMRDSRKEKENRKIEETAQ